MLVSSTFIAGISLLHLASAAPTLGVVRCNYCSSRYDFHFYEETADQGKLTGFLANFWATGSSVMSQITSRKADGNSQKRRIEGTYNIWTQVCHPNGKEGQVPLIIGIHGINFDHSYWEFGYSKEYNFIEAANKAGYAVLTYDRLGVGQSDKPDGHIQQARATGKYSRIWGIGHSFGAIQLTGIAARYPSDLDAPATKQIWRLARAGLSSWRIVCDERQELYGNWKSSSDRFAFFSEGFYDEGAFQRAYDTKQTHTLGEFLTIAEPVSKPASEYKGHVFVVCSIFCGGNCLQKPVKAPGNNLLDDTKVLYPKAASFTTLVPSGAGHALFAHHSTDQVISQIMDWCKKVA
ncbi:Alpha/beta hydrolase family [Rhizoctonia solani]|uniref:Alpha/beta hydrolase family n=1 Tax=Rhizoctonia solani TaxID=456999 RepID=A0A8H7IDF4_9AGAM|nr:Alpha/beta hydrolase family [Rhizoctonia solani]